MFNNHFLIFLHLRYNSFIKIKRLAHFDKSKYRGLFILSFSPIKVPISTAIRYAISNRPKILLWWWSFRRFAPTTSSIQQYFRLDGLPKATIPVFPHVYVTLFYLFRLLFHSLKTLILRVFRSLQVAISIILLLARRSSRHMPLIISGRYGMGPRRGPIHPFIHS